MHWYADPYFWLIVAGVIILILLAIIGYFVFWIGEFLSILWKR